MRPRHGAIHKDRPLPPLQIRTLRLDAKRSADVSRAAAILRSGGTVAFPTETVYGLGANALDSVAVERIFVAKRRPSWDPLIVHIADPKMLSAIADVSGGAELERRTGLLLDAFWPGPLTLLLPRTAAIPDAVTAGRARVGVRQPSHPVARALLAEAGVPVAAPSANRFGRTSPTTATHVLSDLDGRIDAVLDGGPCSVGVESTVLDVAETPMRIYRPGAITVDQIAAVAGPVEMYMAGAASVSQVHLEGEEGPEGLPSPGVGIRHYAPEAQLLLVEGAAALLEVAASKSTTRLGVLLPDLWPSRAGMEVYPWGPWSRPDVLAQRLFAGLRELDRRKVSLILCPLPPADGLGAALRDRLEKAARPR